MKSRSSSKSERYKVIEVGSTLHEAKLPEERILPELRSCGFSEDSLFGVKLALEEAMTNAVKHGNCYDCTKCVSVRYSITPRRAIIIVRDHGAGFSPDRVPDPTSPERLAVPNGRGIMLMRAYMTKVEYRDQGREVYLMKKNDRYRSRPSRGKANN